MVRCGCCEQLAQASTFLITQIGEPGRRNDRNLTKKERGSRKGGQIEKRTTRVQRKRAPRQGDTHLCLVSQRCPSQTQYGSFSSTGSCEAPMPS